MCLSAVLTLAHLEPTHLLLQVHPRPTGLATRRVRILQILPQGSHFHKQGCHHLHRYIYIYIYHTIYIRCIQIHTHTHV